MNEKRHIKDPAALQRGLPGRLEPQVPAQHKPAELPSRYPRLQEKEGQQNSSSALAERQWNYRNWEGWGHKHQAINVKAESGKTK